MKRFFAFMLFFALCSAGVRASGPLRIGFRGGAAVSNYSMERTTVGDTELSALPATVGWQAGLAVRLTIPKFIQIQPELVYGSMRYNYKLGSIKNSVTVKRIELPVMLGFNISSMRIFGGPVMRLSHSESPSGDLGVKYSDSKVASQFGVGFDIGKFFFDVRYTTYFGKVENTFKYSGNATHARVRDDAFTFSMGFLF